MTATNNNEKYFMDPAEETQKAVTAYKLASSDEDADFSASLAIGFDCNKPYSAIKWIR